MTSRVTNCCKKSIWQTCDKVWQYIFPGAERHAHSTLSVQKNRNERIKWSSLFSGPCGPCVWWCSKSALGCLDRGKWFYFFNLSSVVLSFWKSCLWNILELGSLMFFEWPWSACSELGHQAVAVSKRKFRYAITWHDVRVEQTMNRRMGQAGYLWRRGRNRKKGRQRN